MEGQLWGSQLAPSSVAQPGAVLPPGEYLTMSGDILVCVWVAIIEGPENGAAAKRPQRTVQPEGAS